MTSQPTPGQLFRGAMFVVGAFPWALVAVGQRPRPLLDVYARVCHQIPARTLEFADTLMLCCSRCAGIYAGIALGALIAVPRRWLPAMRWVFLGACFAMLAEVITQNLAWHPIWHATRLASGVGFGLTLSSWISGSLRAAD